MQKSKPNDSIEDEKLAILKIFLKNAPFEHWNNKNLEISSKECGFPENYANILFQNEIEGLTNFFHQQLNNELASIFSSKNKFSKVTDKLTYLIELKLELLNKYRPAIPFLVQYSLTPKNILKTQSHLWDNCNLMWSLAGDKSTDHNYYTKRSLLSYVYSSTLMFWLSDNSPEYIDTKNFIRKKISEVLKLGKYKEPIIGFFKKLAE